jgi:hypothetical protein
MHSSPYAALKTLCSGIFKYRVAQIIVMVYAQAAKKTAGYMLTAMVLSLAVVTFMAGDFQPIGRVTSPGVVPDADGGTWIIFLLGVFVGAIVAATYFYVAHLEAKRQG